MGFSMITLIDLIWIDETADGNYPLLDPIFMIYHPSSQIQKVTTMTFSR
jgi:hypothetical protein